MGIGKEQRVGSLIALADGNKTFGTFEFKVEVGVRFLKAPIKPVSCYGDFETIAGQSVRFDLKIGGPNKPIGRDFKFTADIPKGKKQKLVWYDPTSFVRGDGAKTGIFAWIKFLNIKEVTRVGQLSCPNSMPARC